MFRSMLEAKWSVFFDSIKVKWQYEPEKFYLPDDMIYTPDFYLENIGWFEIKPSVDQFYCKLPKYKSFVANMNALVGDGKKKAFIVICAPFPSFTYYSDQTVMLFNGLNDVRIGRGVGYTLFSQHEYLQDCFREGKQVFIRMMNCMLSSASRSDISREPKSMHTIFIETLINQFGVDFNTVRDFHIGKERLNADAIQQIVCDRREQTSALTNSIFTEILKAEKYVECRSGIAESLAILSILTTAIA